MYAKIIVVGIATTDIIACSDHLPDKGETVYGGDCSIQGGGRGSTLAVAASRLGAETVFITRIGTDDFGNSRFAELTREGINTDYIAREQDATGALNLVMVDRAGDLKAVTSLGGGSGLSAETIVAARPVFRDATIMLIHPGIPQAALDAAFSLAREYGLFIILNPSPARAPLSPARLKEVHVLICNKKELETLTGVRTGHLETTIPAGRKLIKAGAGAVVCTLGEEGAVLITADRDRYFETFAVDKKDTSGGGESFTAAFAWFLSHTRDLRWTDVSDLARYEEDFHKAIPFACACSALAVTRTGSLAAMPTITDVDKFLAGHGRPLATPGSGETLQDRHDFLKDKARKIRTIILRMVTEAGSGHPGGALSATEVMTVLYFHEMTLNSNRPDWPDRDRFILSKGHAAPVVYACLIEKGILKESDMGRLRKLGSPLQGHPDMRKCPGIEMSTGSLGQGLSVANGIALGLKQDKRDQRVYVLLGDGELQEGQIWEAAMSSVHFKLDNLCAIVDYNGLQIGGSIGKVKSTLEPLAAKMESFGWFVLEINGNSIAEVMAAFRQARLVKGRPTMIIAHTLKGKGVSFMERSVEYHGKVPSLELLKRALDELEKGD